MTKREILLEQLEETVFALMMEDVEKEEGRKALEENERLKEDECAAVPVTVYRKGLATIRRQFSQQNRRVIMRTTSKVISRVAVIVLVMLLLFTTAFATIPELRAKTLNLIVEVFDDRTRIEFRESAPEAQAEENKNIVGWVPEGFELVDKGETEVVAWEKYANLDGAFVEVNIYHSDGLAYGVDTENAKVDEIVINGYAAIISFEENDIQIACPVIESKRMHFIRGENVSGEIVLRVAQSIDIG